MLPMAHALSRPRKTVEDLHALPDDVRAELIAGEIYVTPSPSIGHQSVSRRLLVAFSLWAERTGAGHVFAAPLDVHLPSGDVVEPDLIFVAEANGQVLQDWIRGTPDLLVEIVSPTHPERDRLVKRDLYARNGVPEYWIVEPADRAVELLRLEGGLYVPAGYLQASGVLRSPSLPGFSLPVAEIFGA
jgi:Uma2 family endonuclease